MRLILAIIATKVLIIIGKLMGKKSSSTPGAIAQKICPDIITKLSRQVKKDIIAVCGTNGKTTTNNLIYSSLTGAGYKVVCNNVGANMIDGVATAFASMANVFGKLDADYACIEIDELSTVKVFKVMKPDYMVLTNLFRDQLDRYGEIDITIEALKKAVSLAGDVTLVLNADDPLVTSFGIETKKNIVYYGIDEKVSDSLNETKEGRFCRFCGNELIYDYNHYSHLGSYKCEKCDFKRPCFKYKATKINTTCGLEFLINDTPISVNYKGFYNIYNLLAAYSVFELTGLDVGVFNASLSHYKPQIGRMESFDIGVEAVLNLAKNPAGFNQAISTVLTDTRKKNIIIAVNDKASDGRDISWLWDVDFESLNNDNSNKFAVCGIRHNDLNVRLKYADITANDYENIKAAIEDMRNDCEVLYILVNYTMLFSTQDILRGLSK